MGQGEDGGCHGGTGRIIFILDFSIWIQTWPRWLHAWVWAKQQQRQAMYMGCVCFIFCCRPSNWKVSASSCWQAQLCKNVLCLKSLFNSLTVICFHLPCQVVPSSLALAPQTCGGGEKVVTATGCGDVRICAVAMLKYILTIDWPKVSGPPLMWLSLKNAIWCTCDLVTISNQQCYGHMVLSLRKCDLRMGPSSSLPPRTHLWW